ncbi:hypothetical protein D3C87_2044000 [compost metagenome]
MLDLKISSMTSKKFSSLQENRNLRRSSACVVMVAAGDSLGVPSKKATGACNASKKLSNEPCIWVCNSITTRLRNSLVSGFGG